MEVDFQQGWFTQLQVGGEVNQSSVKSAEHYYFFFVRPSLWSCVTECALHNYSACK